MSLNDFLPICFNLMKLLFVFRIVASLNGKPVEISFTPGSADVAPGGVKIVRKGGRMQVFEP